LSSNAYTLKIAIDDSKIKEIEKRLKNIVGGGTVGQSALAGVTGGGRGDIAKNLGKLGMIAGGVLAIVTFVSKIASMTVDASPILQSVLKLMNVGVMFLLRPIGDFFGFFLRPIMIWFIRTIALPFYRLAAPIMRQLGVWLGLEATKNLQSNWEGLTAIVTGDFQKAYDMAATQISSDYEKASKVFNDIALSADEWLSTFELPASTLLSDKITDFVNLFSLPRFDLDLGDKLTEFIDNLTLPDWTTDLYIKMTTWVMNLPLPKWSDLTNKIAWFKASLRLPSFTDINNAFNALKTEISTVIDTIRDFFLGIWEFFTGGNKDDNRGNTTNNNTVYATFDNAGKYFSDRINDAGAFFNDLFSGYNQGSNG